MPASTASCSPRGRSAARCATSLATSKPARRGGTVACSVPSASSRRAAWRALGGGEEGGEQAGAERGGNTGRGAACALGLRSACNVSRSVSPRPPNQPSS
eukprot:251770-Chlamydomonas_euryale.AAC.2